MESLENQRQVFHPSHRPWKSLRNSHIPTASTTGLYIKRKAKTLPHRINDLGWAKLNCRSGPRELAKSTGLAATNPTNPASWNRYLYSGGAPVNLADPSASPNSLLPHKRQIHKSLSGKLRIDPGKRGSMELDFRAKSRPTAVRSGGSVGKLYESRQQPEHSPYGA